MYSNASILVPASLRCPGAPPLLPLAGFPPIPSDVCFGSEADVRVDSRPARTACPPTAKHGHLCKDLATASIAGLLGRALHRPVRTEDTTIAWLGCQDHLAVRALMEELASVRWHCLDRHLPARRTGEFALKDGVGMVRYHDKAHSTRFPAKSRRALKGWACRR